MGRDERQPVGVYFGTNNGSVFASLDEGERWQEIAWHLPTILSIEALDRGWPIAQRCGLLRNDADVWHMSFTRRRANYGILKTCFSIFECADTNRRLLIFVRTRTPPAQPNLDRVRCGAVKASPLVRLAEIREKGDHSRKSGQHRMVNSSIHRKVWLCPDQRTYHAGLLSRHWPGQRLRQLRGFRFRGPRSRSSQRSATRFPGCRPDNTRTSTRPDSSAISSRAASIWISRAASDRWRRRRRSPPAILKWAARKPERICCR